MNVILVILGFIAFCASIYYAMETDDFLLSLALMFSSLAAITIGGSKLLDGRKNDHVDRR